MYYKKHYDDLCLRGQQRIPEEGEYYEKHHIIPKCKGGSNDKSNITTLTAREHYIAHYLLHMIDPEDNSLWYALFCMAFVGNNGQRRYLIGSRVFERLRKERSLKQNVESSLKNLEKAVEAVKGKVRDKTWNKNATEAWIKVKGKGSIMSRDELNSLLNQHDGRVSELAKHLGWSISTVLIGLRYHNIPYTRSLPRNCKQVDCVNLEGVLLNTYSSIKQASKALQMKDHQIQDAIKKNKLLNNTFYLKWKMTN